MRLKKGFTLAEVLIVLMVIGAIATMTIPALMKGVTESQWKTAYKKTYNTLVNLTAMERVSGNLPSTADEKGVIRMFHSLNNYLSVKDYADSSNTYGIDSGNIVPSGGYSTQVAYTDPMGNLINNGTATTGDTTTITFTGTTSPWIVTEDNIAYLVTAGTGGGSSCGTKATINSQTSTSAAIQESCVVVVVDVNGLSSGPNKVEPQQGSSNSGGTTTANLTSKQSLAALTGDRYYIFVGNDGATAGSKTSTVTGRIAADIK